MNSFFVGGFWVQFMPAHCGLYFSGEHARRARQGARREPFKGAWALLRGHEPQGTRCAAQWDALRYRLDADAGAGARAVAYLQTDVENEGGAFDADGALLAHLGALLIEAQTGELVRGHPDFSAALHRRWCDRFRVRVASLRGRPQADFLAALWLDLLDLAAGIVLEDAARFQSAVTAFRRVVREAIHPEGYIGRIVEANDEGTLERQLLAVKALVLMAEAAAHAGDNLWAFAHRGVSVMTAVAYMLYYYFYPGQWRWQPQPDDPADDAAAEATRALFRRHAGFWEMAQFRARSKKYALLLTELRPVYDPSGGGLTTLTHGFALKRGLFGL